MTQPRKTFKVEDFKNHVNMLLSCELNVEEKKCYCDLLELVLTQTKNYRGFTYIIKAGVRPCIEGKVGADCVNPLFTKRHEYFRRYY